MGVPDFYPIFFGSGSYGKHPRPAGRYFNAMIDRIPKARSLALDANALVYLVLPYVFGSDDGSGFMANIVSEMSDEELQLKIFEYLGMLILNLVAAVNPSYALIIAFDGVAPLAKINQQKQRRYASKASPGENLAPIENPTATFSRDRGFPRFNKDCISTGTQFMFDLDEYMQDFLKKNQLYLSVPKIIYSSHLEHGEGEHKIFDFYRQGLVTDDPNPVYDGCHVIYGMDADLIMIAALSEFPDIILARDSIELSFPDLNKDIRPIQQFWGDKSPKNIDINEVRRLIIADMGIESNFAISDFVLLMTLLGNDFLPHPIGNQNAYDLVSIIINAYSSVGTTLTYRMEDRFAINYDGLLVFFNELALKEPEILQVASNQSRMYPSRFFEVAKSGGLFDYGRLRDAWYTNEAKLSYLPSYVGEDPKYRLEWINFNKTPISLSSSLWFQSTVEKKEVAGTLTPMVANMCYQFLRGMMWTLQYYYFGPKSMAWTWSYPYHHSPLFTDMADVLSQINQNISYEERVKFFDVNRIPGEIEFEAPHVLLSIMSPYSGYLVPLELQVYYGIESLLFNQMPLEIAYETDGIPTKKKIWKAVPLVPKIDYPLIMAAVKQARWSTDRWRLWNPVGYVIFEMSQEEIIQYMERERTRHFLETSNEFSKLRKAELSINKGRPENIKSTQRRGGQRIVLNPERDTRVKGKYEPNYSAVPTTVPAAVVSGSSSSGSSWKGSSTRGTRGGEYRGSSTRGTRGEYRGRGSRGSSGGEYRGRGSRGSSGGEYKGRGSRGSSTRGGGGTREERVEQALEKAEDIISWW